MSKNSITTSTIFKSIAFLFIFSSSLHTYGQKDISVKYVTDNNFKIDGVLEEPMWQNAITSSNFNEYFPADNKLVEHQTELRMLYNEDFLYIGIKAYAPGKDYKTPSFERDFSISGADVINLMFDTYSDRANAFLFGINPFGVLREGIIYGGGISGELDLNWSAKWVGESTIHDNYFISEIRIPMSAFKFTEGVKKWKFSSMRSDTQSNTKSSWFKVPQNQDQLNLGYFGDMIFEKPLKQTKSPISVIPYVTPSFNKDYVNNEDTFNFKTGFDAKIPVQNSFMLDLTINPDFSSEDVVSSQNNVTQFEIIQDETRQFFIDNGDLFNRFGLSGNALPFYSRRVGVDTDKEGNTIIVPVNAGAKFTGKVNNKLRVGVLNVQTGGDEEQEISANNNLVVAAEQRIFNKSTIGVFFVNRQATNYKETHTKTKYNRIVGTDLKFYSKDNSFDAQVFLHKSFTPGISSNALSAGTDITLEKRKYTLNFNSQYLNEGFKADLGYLKRTDVVRANPYGDFKIYPSSDAINTIILSLSHNSYWKASEDMLLTESYNTAGGTINFTNGTQLGISGTNSHIYLTKPFDPVRTSDDATPLPIGNYDTNELKVNFRSDKRRDFWTEGSMKYGEFYLGTKFTTDVTFQYRYQPFFTLSLQAQYDDIQLPDPYASGQLWYLGPTFNFTFSKSIFFNTDIQYSSQSESFLMVSRLQWRYAPLSDIFLTYTDVKTTSPIDPVQKGIFLKINYWLDFSRNSKS